MTEIYYRRWKIYFRGVMLLLLPLAYIALLFVKPSDHPYISIALYYFLAAVIILGLLVMLYVMWFGIGCLWDAFSHKPIVIITDQALQVYDTSIRRYHIFNWENVAKIERGWYNYSLFYDVYTIDDKRLQLLEVSRWRRFILKLNTLAMGGAAVRIPADDLAADKTWLLAELQAHIGKN